MKTRHCLAAAAGLLFAGAAHAQSSVTLYGALDEDVLYTSKSLNPTNGRNAGSQLSLVDSGWQASRFGITGSEDLGAGLRALFKLESGINVTNGGFNDSNGNFFGRQAWLALHSQYGEVKMGLQFSPFMLALHDLDPRDFSFFGSTPLIYVNNAAATGIFTPNAISYSSPQIAGFHGSALLSLGNVPGSFSAGRAYSASLNYRIGGLFIDAAFWDSNAGSTTITPVPSTREFEGRVIGASYHFGRVTATASFTNYKVAGSFDNNVYGGGLEYSVSPAFTLNATANYITDRNDTGNHSLLASVGGQYSLSIRTTLYAQVGIVDNHGAMYSGLSLTGAKNLPVGTTFGADLGIRHTF